MYVLGIVVVVQVLCTTPQKPDSLAGWVNLDWFMAQQAQEEAHALLVDSMARQAQVVAQAEHALEIVLRKLLIEQAHQLQIVGTVSAGLVIGVAQE